MHHLSNRHYPFGAIVGQDRLKLALILNAIHPQIGGVLIQGSKGTAKSTAARALAEVLPPIEVVEGCAFHSHPSDRRLMSDEVLQRVEAGEPLVSRGVRVPFVTLPLSATEDRVVGTIDVPTALTTGKARLKPGLLAEAHRGILYVDEVNLLDDHLVDVLLDAAAMGRNIVEREGLSLVHPARFVLIGTMNPEEGELRPQLLDRFGIAVTVEGLTDLDQRVEIMRRLDLWDRDPHALEHAFDAEQRALRERIQAAMKRLPAVRVPREALEGAARRSLEAHVDGHRADLTMIKVAVALAAWHQDDEVSDRHLDEAAPLVLAHRRRSRPFEDPSGGQEPRVESGTRSSGSGGQDASRGLTPPETPPTRLAGVELPVAKARGQRAGKGGASQQTPKRGKKLGVAARVDPDAPVDVAGSLLAAAMREGPSRATVVPRVEPGDLRSSRISGATQRAVCFVVDASASMGSRKRLEMARQAARDLLQQSYRGRHQVGLITASGKAELRIPLTRDAERVERDVRSIRPAGRTPLAAALALAGQEVRRWADKGLAPIVVVLTDGRANVPLARGGDASADALQAARALAEARVDVLVIDTENDFVNLGLGRELADAAGADYLRTDAEASRDVVSWIAARP